MAVRSACLLLLLLCASAAPAEAPPQLPQIDRDVAAHHFELGQEAYGQGKYAVALDEFHKARAIHPAPAFDYNIALCLDRLERWGEAAAAYRRFLESAHREDPAIRARIAALDARAAQAPPIVVVAPAPAPPRPPPRRADLFAPIVVATVALAAGVAGGALLGTAIHDADAASAGCAPACNVGGLGLRAGAGYALLATAGVALVIDVPLWVRALRRARAKEGP